MDKTTVMNIIRKRIDEAKEELSRQEQLYAKDKGHAKPDYGWYATRIRAFNEALELIGMIDKN